MIRKVFITTSAVLCLLPVMAQKNYEMGIPGNSNYDYLKDFAPLKQYVDRDKYPNFKLGVAIGVDDYKNNSNVREITNNYFMETVAGNAMKMASCVDGNGNMNFSRVTEFVNSATAAGVSVYGHTLAWHSQQPIGWLRNLLKDKPAPVDPDANVNVYNPETIKDFTNDKSVGWHSDTSQYGYSLNFSDENGLNVHTTKNLGSWEVQFLALTGLSLEKNMKYKISMMIKGSKAGKLHTGLGSWGNTVGKDIPFTTDWKQVEVEYEPSKGGDFLLVQCGDFVGDIYIKNIILSKEGKARKVTENRRCVVVDASARVNAAWDNQFWIVTDGFKQGAQFEFSADVRADKAAKATTQIHNAPGSYVHYAAIGDVNFTTDWKKVTCKGSLDKAGKSIAFNLSEFADANKYYFDNISFKVNGKELLKNGNLEGTDVSSFIVKDSETKTASPKIADQISYLYTPSPVPLTDQEKHDTLVYAMDKWISGMMQACNGKVKAWDVVNEAISGGDNDGDGYYDLQHSDGYKSGTWDVGGDAFYWQDYMGDLEYVRQAVRLARKYGPEDVKLFVNDYNLESFWDNNKKLRSLIHWIKKWEADGVTKIDGIGTQMHISCSMDDNTLNNRKKYIKQMFQLMAQSGKLVRVSEFDMGMDDANGNAVSTANMTEAMHQRMADYYEWIIKTYLEIIPADQQWGICQWCMTDSPANSGWRANTPVGIWTLNDFYRKHTYAGYVRGLGGIVYSGINSPVVNTQVLSFKKGIYTLDGVKLKYAPQCGVYIQNGKKIVKSIR